jgi:hypothetical protein
MRAASQARFKAAAPYLASDAMRSSLRTTIEAAYVAGLYTDSELQDQLDSIEHNTDRIALAMENAQLKKRIAITKDLEAEYTTLYLANLITDATFRSDLESIGLQPDLVNAIAAKAEARANATLQKTTMRLEAAQERQTESEARRAALANYRTGQIGLPGLIAALVATGLTAIQAAAWGDLAQAQKQGNLRWLYGNQLSPSDAALLRSRVAALTDQRKRNFLTDDQYEASLAALKIPAATRNALRAAASALVTPKTSASLFPVETT